MTNSHGIISASILLILFVVTTGPAGDPLEIGSSVPDFTLPVALSDSTIRLADFTGKKVVILHFWKSH